MIALENRSHHPLHGVVPSIRGESTGDRLDPATSGRSAHQTGGGEAVIDPTFDEPTSNCSIEAPMTLKPLCLLLLAGTAVAAVPPPDPDSPFYIPPPPFIDVDDNVVLESVLKGIWETPPGAAPLKFEIIEKQSHHFSLRVLTQSYCKELLIDQYALTIGFEAPSSADVRTSDLHITMAEIKFDGDREEANCLGMPVWITFKFSSPPNYSAASVTVREQFETGPDENAYEMTRTR